MAEQRASWRELREQRMSEPEAQQAYEAARLAFTLGAEVRRLRETQGWSQTELARRSHMTQSAVARFEAGGTVPTLPVLHRLAQALGKRLEVQIGGAAHPETATPQKPSARKSVTAKRSAASVQLSGTARNRMVASGKSSPGTVLKIATKARRDATMTKMGTAAKRGLVTMKVSGRKTAR